MVDYLNNYFRLTGKTAAVIGGGGVLAGTMSEGLAQAGADVVILDINLDNGQKKAAQLSKYDIRSSAIRVDASRRDDLQQAADTIKQHYGRCDILINAPGVNSSTPFFEIEEDEWDRILDINLKSIFLSCQIFGTMMLESGRGGSIINISSASAGPPLSKVFTYGISKAGINNLTQYLAREWATSGIRVNAIAPGFFPAEQNRKILTEERVNLIMNHTPMKRFGEPEELVGAVIWLSSDKASSFVTGAIIHVDGGFSAMTI